MSKNPFQIHKKAEKALRDAVYKVVERHRKLGTTLSVWKNGKVVNISAKHLKLN